MTRRRAVAVVRLGTGLALAGAAVATVNRVTMPRLSPGVPVLEPVTVCVPARDEADRLPALIADLRAQVGVPRLRVLILDDASTDDTAAIARAAAGGDPRITVLRSTTPPPPGWTGKAAACAALARAVAAQDRAGRDPVDDSDEDTGGGAATLIFLDADVRLAPEAVAAAVAQVRRGGAALVSPWPWQRAGTPAEALVQPLLCWSWAATLPVVLGNRSRRPSTAVACGQFLAFDAAAYGAIGGHAAVAGSATEDLDLARTLRRAGYRTRVVAAGGLASTRMYRGGAELAAGYTRWLWSAYGGSPAAAAVVGVAAALAFWVPPAAALLGRGGVRRVGAVGYAAAVVSRLLARRVETGAAPRAADLLAAAAHPVAVAAYQVLVVRSHRARRRGRLRWKGRALTGVRG
ncbi:glycosyltransferase [Nocardia farcinica]|uniref:glycosyltransferase n=1 Tax=Nocardia farcinica TaxID=37329 RepID=UPI003CC7F3FF